MRANVKNIKATEKTTTLVFNTETIEAQRDVIAISILLGYYNPLRKNMINETECLKELNRIKEKGEFTDIIEKVKKHIIY